ncbi:class I SAM-dependent methyltransferase [Luteimonas sp. BDR2-5]|uniref:methyltransferase domain-containing protein n=1 Tax=Proluteimonas luteida TaxID=2878685 RepID=UPI001E42DD89|nr:methyltransferase domain-containing protein [Luteimonas sp. BDR2-5]MCD9027702.1 class I SAM-dependent methyltransferase [Luteimonas sp. BDR2-5]
MPATSPPGQPDSPSDWFASAAGRAVIDSEHAVVSEALAGHPGLPWLWLAPSAADAAVGGRGLRLTRAGGLFDGPVRCACPLPLPSEAFGSVVLQHVVGAARGEHALLDEAVRVLAPGGYLWLLVLNPLTPYRWRWRGQGLDAAEPLAWRRRMRQAGLAPDAVSRGVGPSWRETPSTTLQDGPGLRAAYVLRGQKRTLPLTPVRQRSALRLPGAVPAA